MLTALAIRHVAFEDLGAFASVLREQGFACDYLEAVDGLAGLDPLAADLLVVLGGPIGAYEEDKYPFVRDELALLERRLAHDRPVLGVCLGAQLIARALGARVYPGPAKEIGWSALSLTAAGRASSLHSLGEDGIEVLHWHGDTFDLPQGAVRLASTPAYENQAFAWGRATLALQFHAEVTARGLEHWFVGHACELAGVAGLSVAGLRAQTLGACARLQPAGRRALSDWLAQIEI